MLLYDQIILDAWKCRKEVGDAVFGVKNIMRYEFLRKCAVYELSNVIPHFQDWEREKAKRIPHRPPYERLWCEWQIDHNSQLENGEAWPGEFLWTVGIPFGRCPPEFVAEIRARAVEPSVALLIGKATHFFYGQPFYRMDSLPPTELVDVPPADVKKGAVWFDPDTHILAASEDYTEIWHIKNIVGDKKDIVLERGENYAELTAFGLPMLTMHEGSGSLFKVWPMFLAFGLMNCRNITTNTVQPEPRLRKHCVKHGVPMRKTYKVLNLTVPKTHKAGHGTGEPTGRRHRFHMVSGHPRELRHPRYKEPGWYWVSEHTRGDAELGVVDKTYKAKVK